MSMYLCINESCAMRGNNLADQAASALNFLCPVCKRPLHVEGIPTLYSKGLEPEHMPTYIALQWVEFNKETHPRIKLHWLVDTTEICVRWCVAIALAEVVHANQWELPKSVTNQIGRLIERPTLGIWLKMLRELSNSAPKRALLVPKIFQLYDSTFDPNFRISGETIGTSFLILRNQIAHSGGFSTKLAKELLSSHRSRFEKFLQTICSITSDLRIIAKKDEVFLSLKGVKPLAIDQPLQLNTETGGPWLMGEKDILSLPPLVSFKPISQIQHDGSINIIKQEPTPQIYFRSDTTQLNYIPLDDDESHSDELYVKDFRDLFRLDDPKQPLKKQTTDGLLPEDALKEAQVLVNELVGRHEEIKIIKQWLKGRDSRQEGIDRIAWIHGGPGMGKSMLMAKISTDSSNAPQKRQGIFVHRFRAGDARNSQSFFLRLLQSALWQWPPLNSVTEEPKEEESEGKELINDIAKRLKRIHDLSSDNPKEPSPRFLIFIDGLDEIAIIDSSIVKLIKKLAFPGTLWIVAGQPEYGLDKAFIDKNCETLFGENGLPEMADQDIRAMLVEGLEKVKYKLFKRDQDTNEGVKNPFVELVTQKANGSPLYVHFVLEDLLVGNLTIYEENKLPDGLNNYYSELLDRMGLSTAKRDLPLIVCLLAKSMEPLNREALAILLSGNIKDIDAYRGRTDNAIRLGSALFKNAPTTEGYIGITIYHQSFREYVVGRAADQENRIGAIPPSPFLVDVVKESEKLLTQFTDSWSELPAGNLKNHLFRWGNKYSLLWEGEQGVQSTCERLTSFSYLYNRIETLGPAAVFDILDEYRNIPVNDYPDLREWYDFIRSRAYVIHRGGGLAFLQSAAAYPVDSLISREANIWLSRGEQPTSWLRPLPFLFNSKYEWRLQGHQAPIIQLDLCSKRQLVSSDVEGNIGIWDIETGRNLRWIRSKMLYSVRPFFSLLPPNKTRLLFAKIASYNSDSSDPLDLSIWDVKTGTLLSQLQGHTRKITSLVMHFDGKRAVSGSYDSTAIVWDLDAYECIHVLKHSSEILGIYLKADGKHLITYSPDELKIWDLATGVCKKTLEKEFYNDKLKYLTSDGRFVLWEGDRVITHEVFDGKSGNCLCRFREENRWNAGFKESFDPNGLYCVLAAWHDTNYGYSENGSVYKDVDIRIMNLQTGVFIKTQPLLSRNVKFLVFGVDNQLLIVDEEGELVLCNIENGESIPLPSPWVDRLDWVYHTPSCNQVIFHPNQRHLVCFNPYEDQGHYNGIIGFWDLHSGEYSNEYPYWPYGGFDLMGKPELFERLQNFNNSYNYKYLLTESRYPPRVSYALKPWEVWNLEEHCLASTESAESAIKEFKKYYAEKHFKSASSHLPDSLFFPDDNLRVRVIGTDILIENTKQQLHPTDQAEHKHYEIISLATCKDIVVSGNADGRIHIRKAPKFDTVRTFQAHNGPLHSITFTGNKRIVFSLGEDGFLRSWDIESGKKRFEVKLKRNYEEKCLGLSSSNQVQSIWFGTNHFDHGEIFSPSCQDPQRKWSTLWGISEQGNVDEIELFYAQKFSSFASGSGEDIGSIEDCPSLEFMAVHPFGSVILTHSDSNELSLWNTDSISNQLISHLHLDDNCLIFMGSDYTWWREENEEALVLICINQKGDIATYDAISGSLIDTIKLRQSPSTFFSTGLWRVLYYYCNELELIGDVKFELEFRISKLLGIFPILQQTQFKTLSSNLQWITGNVDDRSISLWNVDTVQCGGRWYSDARITCCAMDSDDHIVVGDAEGKLVFLEIFN